MPELRRLDGREEGEVDAVTLTRDVYVIRQSESGGWYVIPIEKAETFLEDELEGDADYARYIELEDLLIYDFDEE